MSKVANLTGLLALALLLPAGGPVSAQTPAPASVLVYHDSFDSATTYASYTGFGGATVSIAGGSLNVQVPAGAPNAGLRVRLPRGGKGVRCIKFDGVNIPPGLTGRTLRWTVYGYDDVTGAETVLLETTLQEVSATGLQNKADPVKEDGIKLLHKKSDGRTAMQFIPGKKAEDIKTKTWDTRRGGTQVQLEITWKDGTKYNSSWIDPPASTFAGFDLATNVSEVSVGDSGGAEVHTAAEPAQLLLTAFDRAELDRLDLHWLLQAFDSDAVVVGTVTGTGRFSRPVLDGDSRLRLRVDYALDRVLTGRAPKESFTVLHTLDRRGDARRFQPGDKLILFLRQDTVDGRRAAAGAPFWDFGQPAGVIPFSPRNLRAVATRLEALYGGLDE